jgi:hypothetical protein
MDCDCNECSCDTEQECPEKNCKCADGSKTVTCVCIAASELRD